MSLILCPECGAKISEKAVSCPHCGFQSCDPKRPISEQDTYELVPTFDYDIAEWNPNGGDLSVISYEDNRNLVQYFGKWETIKDKLPAIAEVIGSMAEKEHIMVAKMDSYVKKLIEDGVYRFAVDRNGEVLPTIRDAKQIVKQVRLEDMTFSPNLVSSLNNLSMHAVMAQILDEIEYVGDAIRELHVELQNDRLAIADSAKDKLRQARKIQNARIRELAILEAVNSATDAKRVLMRNFGQNLMFIAEHSQKSDLEMIFKPKGERDIATRAIDAFQSLLYITHAVQVECEGYGMLGEYDACRESLEEFKTFIIDKHLNRRDTLLLLNENSSKKDAKLVQEFTDIAKRITAFDTSRYLEANQMSLLLASGTGKGGIYNAE